MLLPHTNSNFIISAFSGPTAISRQIFHLYFVLCHKMFVFDARDALPKHVRTSLAATHNSIVIMTTNGSCGKRKKVPQTIINEQRFEDLYNAY